MNILICNDYEEMSKKAANMIAAQLIVKPDSVLGLATGGTPTLMYRELVRLYKEGVVDFSKMTSFNLDEYYPIQKSSPRSYYDYMRINLFDHVNIRQGESHIPNGEASDPHKECKEYDEMINACGGIDLQLLGIGGNGHIGFNEPGEYFEMGTHLVNLNEETKEANARFFEEGEEVPTKALSMGIGNIMNAKKILLIANGTEKADAIYDMIHGKISPKLPASILQLHRDVTVILDKDAASKFMFS